MLVLLRDCLAYVEAANRRSPGGSGPWLCDALRQAIASYEAGAPAVVPSTDADLLEAAKEAADHIHAIWAEWDRRRSMPQGIRNAVEDHLLRAIAAEVVRRAGAVVAAPAEKPCPRCDGNGWCCAHSTTCAAPCPFCGGTGKVPHDSGSARGADADGRR